MAPLPPVLAEDVFIDGDPGVTLYLRNKRAAGVARFGPTRTVLMVHGATYPSHVMFDAAFEGMSWMDRLAARGFDVWALDLRGYGRSSRPPAMAAKPSANPPFCTTDEAQRDVAAALAHIRRTRRIDRNVLIGWSWGTVITGAYAADHPGEVERLVLLAPLWMRDGPSPIFVPPGPLGAYRSVSRDASRERWLGGIPEARREAVAPRDWVEHWLDAVMESDPEGAAHSPPVTRAPNGVLADLQAYWQAGRPYYDPGRISCPTLVLVGEWDRDTPPDLAQEVFKRLTGAKEKRLVVFGEATHSIVLERSRLALFREVETFLEAA